MSYEPTEAERQEGREWMRSRPPAVQARIRSHPPGLYRLKTTGQHVLTYSYTENEDGSCTTCQVLALEQYNGPLLGGDRRVFGIAFDDLELIEAKPWTLDDIDEVLGP